MLKHLVALLDKTFREALEHDTKYGLVTSGYPSMHKPSGLKMFPLQPEGMLMSQRIHLSRNPWGAENKILLILVKLSTLSFIILRKGFQTEGIQVYLFLLSSSF
ncbi:hypothetical protein CRN36_07000 [Vibrio vulnificus]|nr:hypothetical protein CRN36_07000 [Vibrio vulnificus]